MGLLFFSFIQSFRSSVKANEHLLHRSYYARDTRANATRSGPFSPVGCANNKERQWWAPSAQRYLPTSGKKADPEKRLLEKVRDSMFLKNLNHKEMNLEGLKIFFFFFKVGFGTFIHTQLPEWYNGVNPKTLCFVAGKMELWWHFVCLVKLS